MSDRLTIRAARAGDAALIHELILELAEYEKLRDQVAATVEDVAATLFGPAPAAEVVIAEWEGAPVGFALFFPTYSTFLRRAGMWLEDLYVRPSHRGRGIGRRLLAHLAAIAARRGCGRLEWAVLDWNEPAIEFYRHLGARPQDEWTTWRVAGDDLKALAGRG